MKNSIKIISKLLPFFLVSILTSCSDLSDFDGNTTNQAQPNTSNLKADTVDPTPTTIQEPKPSIKKISVKELTENIQIKVQPSTQEEKYFIYFSWPLIEENRKIRIRRDQILSIIEPTQTTFSHEVDHNQILNYTFDVLDESLKIEKTFSKQVIIPRDFVVKTGQNQITENPLVVNRFFMHEVPLQTFGAETNIKANEFLANDGVIETFPENSKATWNTQGRSGGNITLNFTTAVGKLRVIMRGENGGDGTNGAPYERRASDGNPAGRYDQFCEPLDRPRKETWSVFTNNQNKIEPMTTCFCSQYGADAGNGANGAKGRQGNPAKDGGDSGNFKISVIDGNAFDVFVEKFFGVAGNPGQGGDGQDGGLGGGNGRQPGSRTDCRGLAGANGAKGPQGDPGQPASNGKLGTLCVYIDSKGKNDCN